MPMPRFRLRTMMVVVAAIAIYLTLMLSVFDQVTLLATLPIGGYILFKRLGRSGLSGSILGGLVNGLCLILWDAAFRGLSYPSLLHRLHTMTTALAFCGSLGSLIGCLADYVSWLLLGPTSSRGSGAHESGSPQKESPECRDSLSGR